VSSMVSIRVLILLISDELSVMVGRRKTWIVNGGTAAVSDVRASIHYVGKRRIYVK
jgi:hypothetical protein